MNKRAIISDMSSMYPSMSMILAAMANDKSTPEEKAERRIIREEMEKKRRTTLMIRKGVCPICSGKLKRGKKNKQKDYKREWTCINCGGIYSI